MTDPSLASVAALTVRDPDAAARDLLARRWTRDVQWSALVALACLSVVIGQLTILASGIDPAALAPVQRMPFVMAAIQIATIWFTAFSLWRVGRRFGGADDPQGAMTLVIWLEALLVAVQAAALLLLGVPVVSSIVLLGGTALAFWCFVRFAMVLHGFERPFVVAFATIVVAFFVLTGAAIAVGLLGLAPYVTPPAP